MLQLSMKISKALGYGIEIIDCGSSERLHDYSMDGDCCAPQSIYIGWWTENNHKIKAKSLKNYQKSLDLPDLNIKPERFTTQQTKGTAFNHSGIDFPGLFSTANKQKGLTVY